MNTQKYFLLLLFASVTSMQAINFSVLATLATANRKIKLIDRSVINDDTAGFGYGSAPIDLLVKVTIVNDNPSCEMALKLSGRYVESTIPFEWDKTLIVEDDSQIMRLEMQVKRLLEEEG